jgi:hypothetical protein
MKYMIGYNFFKKYSYKIIKNHLILHLNLISDDLIYLWNQTKIYTYQEREFESVLRSKIQWFVFYKNVNLSMYYEARFGDLML